jgi:probable rRNA maturation factor
MNLSVFNRQRKIAIDRAALEAFARRALPLCAREPGRGLTNIESVEIILISDRRMSALHRRFMGIAGPTDVITFQHAEIFISTETARRQAREQGTTLRHELHLYIVHGLLHLHGFDDRALADRRRMHAAQEKVVRLATSGRK